MLTRDTAALVVVDVQGKLAALMYNKENFFAAVVKTIQCARVLEIPILWNEQLPDKLGESIPEVREAMGHARPLVKKTFSCCGNPDFVSALRETKRSQILLIGMETHVCVYQTAIDLLQMGFVVHLVVDAVSSRTAENRRIGSEKIRDAGGQITSLETALFEMLRVAEGDVFRQAIKIIK